MDQPTQPLNPTLAAATPADGPTKPNPWDAVVLLPPETKFFRGKEYEYFVVDEPERLTVERLIQFEIKKIELAFVAEYDFVIEQNQKAMRFCKENEPHLAFVTLFNLTQGMLDAKNRRPLMYLICTLAIAREGENLETWDPVLALEKIRDWSGLADGFFFGLVARLFAGFNERLETISRAFSAIPPNPAYERERTASLRGYQQFDPATGS